MNTRKILLSNTLIVEENSKMSFLSELRILTGMEESIKKKKSNHELESQEEKQMKFDNFKIYRQGYYNGFLVKNSYAS